MSERDGKVIKSTPGPWYVEYLGSFWRVTHGQRDDSGYRDDVVSTKENVTLMAAAPDLLVACIAVRESCPADSDLTPAFEAAWKLLLAAIAKAGGE